MDAKSGGSLSLGPGIHKHECRQIDWRETEEAAEIHHRFSLSSVTLNYLIFLPFCVILLVALLMAIQNEVNFK